MRRPTSWVESALDFKSKGSGRKRASASSFHRPTSSAAHVRVRRSPVRGRVGVSGFQVLGRASHRATISRSPRVAMGVPEDGWGIVRSQRTAKKIDRDEILEMRIKARRKENCRNEIYEVTKRGPGG
jgi:hypothetical protein